MKIKKGERETMGKGIVNQQAEMIGTVPSEVDSRRATAEEARKYGIKDPLADVEWFVDPGSASFPAVSINGQGVMFNAKAAKLMDLITGDLIEIGYLKGKLLFRGGTSGFKVKLDRQGIGGTTFVIQNKRLATWFTEKRIKKQKFTLSVVQAGVWAADLK